MFIKNICVSAVFSAINKQKKVIKVHNQSKLSSNDLIQKLLIAKQNYKPFSFYANIITFVI